MRQVVLGRYIADFVAPSIRLVVEVDGGHHVTDAVRRNEARRDRALARLGYRVVHVAADMMCGFDWAPLLRRFWWRLAGRHEARSELYGSGPEMEV